MKFDFIGRKRLWFAISGIIILVGFLALIVRGLNFGIEFKGGTSFDLRLKKSAQVGEIREAISPLGLGKSVIQPVGRPGDNEVLIRTRALSEREQARVIETLDNKWGVDRRAVEIQTVGPGWGANVTQAALIALGLSFAALLVYISWRFEFKMAVSALVALFHDLLITVGIYALVGKEVTPNTVAALLSILGYSLYDTIVVFHRVLENSPRIGRRTYSTMVNDSINEVFVRSINTSLTTLLPVTALLFLGGEVLRDFAFALFVGITSGAYSSIFTASPILTVWKESEPRYKAFRVRAEKRR
jgi:SecD/SecF fusion protein